MIVEADVPRLQAKQLQTLKHSNQPPTIKSWVSVLSSTQAAYYDDSVGLLD